MVLQPPGPSFLGFGVGPGGFRRGSGAGAVRVVWSAVVGCCACRSWPASAPAPLVCLGGPPAAAPGLLGPLALARLVLCAPPFGFGGRFLLPVSACPLVVPSMVDRPGPVSLSRTTTGPGRMTGTRCIIAPSARNCECRGPPAVLTAVPEREPARPVKSGETPSLPAPSGDDQSNVCPARIARSAAANMSTW